MKTSITKVLVLLAFTTITIEAFAAAQTVLGRVREGYFLIAGYPSTITSNGPPQNGLVSFVEFFSSSAQSIAMSNGVVACSSVPASGSVTASLAIPTALQAFLGTTGNVTMTYATPVVTAPAGWSGAGSLFQKRVQITKAGGIAFAMEFNCNTNELFGAISIPGDNITNSTRDINMYISKNGAALAVDFFMTVTLSNRTTLVDSQAVRLTTTDGDNYKVWNTGVTMRDQTQTCGGSPCSDQYGIERSVLEGSSVSKQASIYVKITKPNLAGQTTPTLRAATISEATTASAAVGTFDFDANEPNQNATAEKSGCINFNTLANPANGNYCGGMGANLTTPTAPLSDSAGSFEANWVKNTLKSKMKFAN